MGAFERYYQETLIHWSNPISDGYGQATWGIPEEVECRWQQRPEVLLYETGAEEKLSMARIYVPEDSSFEVGDYIKLGTLSDIDSNYDDSGYIFDSSYDGNILHPENISDAYRVLRVDKIPSIGNTMYIHILRV